MNIDIIKLLLRYYLDFFYSLFSNKNFKQFFEQKPFN